MCVSAFFFLKKKRETSNLFEKLYDKCLLNILIALKRQIINNFEEYGVKVKAKLFLYLII
jgi:hypothetical protein